MSITKNCMIVNISLGTWSGHRLDKEASREITESKGADADAARVNKHLIPKEMMKRIITASSAIRTHFYAKTLPWKDNGDRLLTRMLYTQFVEEHQRLVREFNGAVDEFLDKTYPIALAQAEFRMGAMFNADDYPPVSVLRHKFYANLDIDAVSEAKDFRVALDKEEVENIRSDIETALSTRMSRAMEELWQRLATTVRHFASKMADEKAIFRDTTITNLEEMIELLPALNIAGDENLTRIYDELRGNLMGYDPKDLRKDPAIRSEAALEAQRIADEMAGFMKAFGDQQ